MALVVLLAAGGRLNADDPKAKVGLASAGSALEGFDASVRPQDDFFRYVNGGWIAHTEIPPDRPAHGSFFQLRDKSEASLRTIIEEAAANTASPQGSEARKIGDLYKSFMNKARADELGKKPIEDQFAKVDAIADKAALIPALASLQREGVTGLFGAFVTVDAKHSDQYILYLNQSGLSLPDEAYYRDPKFTPIREKFLAHLEKMLDLAGTNEPKAEAAKVMAVETALARHHWDRVKSRDRTLTYNRMDRKALASLSSGVDWNAWFSASGDAKIDDVVVHSPTT